MRHLLPRRLGTAQPESQVTAPGAPRHDGSTARSQKTPAAQGEGRSTGEEKTQGQEQGLLWDG